MRKKGMGNISFIWSSTSTSITYRSLRNIILFLFIFCGILESQQKLITADSTMLRSHVSALASDTMKGRQSGTIDERRAAEYIEAYFKKLYLQPAGESGSFFQRVPLPRGRVFSPSTIIVQDDTLSYPNDFYFYQIPAGFQVFNQGLIFVGYGIHSEEKQVDSYQGIDVKNKIVVALSSRLWDRKRLPKDFEGNYQSQIRWAKESGATGLLLLDNSQRKRVDQKKTGRKFTAELFDPIDTSGFISLQIIDGKSFARKIFQIENFSNIGPADHASSTAHLIDNIDCEQMISSNMIGMIEGTNLKEEYIVVTAHYDHLGIGTKIAGDSIYNGAMDNASGVAVLLETARLFASSTEKPRRSILFMATGAEELGFYGSKHFITHPTVSLNAITANINIDVIGFAYGSNECWMTLLGAEYNTMESMFEAESEKLGIQIMPNVIPSYYKRSDGYIFAQAGIPALSPASGMHLGDLNDGMNHFLEYYHKPNDEPGKAPINYSVMSLQTEAITNGIRVVANTESRPRWTSELDSDGWLTFREIFGKVRVFFAKIFH